MKLVILLLSLCMVGSAFGDVQYSNINDGYHQMVLKNSNYYGWEKTTNSQDLLPDVICKSFTSDKTTPFITKWQIQVNAKKYWYATYASSIDLKDILPFGVEFYNITIISMFPDPASNSDPVAYVVCNSQNNTNLNKR